MTSFVFGYTIITHTHTHEETISTSLELCLRQQQPHSCENCRGRKQEPGCPYSPVSLQGARSDGDEVMVNTEMIVTLSIAARTFYDVTHTHTVIPRAKLDCQHVLNVTPSDVHIANT